MRLSTGKNEDLGNLKVIEKSLKKRRTERVRLSTGKDEDLGNLIVIEKSLKKRRAS